MTDFSELARLYTAIAEGCDCDHANAVVISERGVYEFRCPDCGRQGLANEATARYLGWIEPETEAETQRGSE